MYKEDQQDMKENVLNFGKEYMDKFSAGAKEHGGKFRDIGLLDQIRNAKEEILDMWSYVSAIEKKVLEINDMMPSEGEYIPEGESMGGV